MNRATPAQLAEVRCPWALAFVFGAESPTSLSRVIPQLNLEPAPGNITFTTTIITLSPVTGRHQARLLPSPSPLPLAAVFPVLRVMRLAVGPKPAGRASEPKSWSDRSNRQDAEE